MVETVLFWIPVVLMAHSYVLFPALLYVLARKKPTNQIVYQPSDTLPFISVLISVYNEEKVIEQRIRNIYQTSYPAQRLELLVGSDHSTDNTDALLEKLKEEFPSLRIFLYAQRKGKGEVLNDLYKEAAGEILILTDAKVQFAPSAIFQLIKHFLNPHIGIVGGNIINRNTGKDGISIQEKVFMAREMVIKFNEGCLWGTSMGAYGACYAIRKELFEHIPEGFAVEDFYTTLRVIEKGFLSIIELNAESYEEVPDLIDEEFRRKVRISSGNFQNLKTFFPLLFEMNPLSFCFFSHKVIRWVGPFLLLMAFICNLFLLSGSSFYLFTFVWQLFLITFAIIDYFLQKIHIHIITLRFITHFYSMNLALLFGFIKYLKGVKTNVWEPTRRAFKKT